MFLKDGAKLQEKIDICKFFYKKMYFVNYTLHFP